MKQKSLFSYFVVCFLLCVNAVNAEDTPPLERPQGNADATKAQAEELELVQQIEKLKAQLRLSREQRAGAKKAERQAEREASKKKFAEAFADFKLPESPSRKQSAAYLDQMRVFLEGYKAAKSQEALRDKIKAIPLEHYDLLVSESLKPSPLRKHAKNILNSVAPENLLQHYVDLVEEHPSCVKTIVRHGWSQKIRSEVVRYLEATDPEQVSIHWFQAAVELNEPQLFIKLHEVAVKSQCPMKYIKRLRLLPEYDYSHTVDVCWDLHKDQDDQVEGYEAMVVLAAEHGHVDALGKLVEQLAIESQAEYGGEISKARLLLLRLIDYRGSNASIISWYKKNQNQLAFDHLHKRFMVPEDF